MKYDIFNRKAPAMPKPSRGTEFCKLLLSQASVNCYSHRPQKTCKNRLFRWQFLHLPPI